MALHFEGDLVEAISCCRDAVALVRAGHRTSRELSDHILFALGQFNALRPEDEADPQPLFATEDCRTVEACCTAIESHLPAEGETFAADPVGANWLAVVQLLFQLYQLLRQGK